MVEPAPSAPLSPIDRLRARLGPRAVAIALALLIEALLALLLLTLAPAILTPEESVPMTIFGVSPQDEPDTAENTPAKPDPAPAVAPQPATQAAPQPATPQPRSTPAPQPTPPPFLDIPLGRMPDIGALPRGPATPATPRRAAGPPNLASVPGDTPRVEGRGPRGEPLYAASWYREPYDSELRGYLSSARGPGWGMVACRTVADFRVDDCVFVGEYPEGSNIARAVLAAAWQFRVRPPRIGGTAQVGEWVRIRIDYDLKRVGQP